MSTACVVHFPHPGEEHKASTQRAFPWNVGSHRRKFLRAPGRLVTDGDRVAETDVVFWGEYEAASLIVDGPWAPSGHLPTSLHEPLITPPPSSPTRQNTDPWVFGERFLYSNCKQLTPQGRPSALQSLPRGSVILFGSRVGGAFCLDTVFVVADSVRYDVADAADLPIDPAFRTCTIDSLAAYEHPTIDLRAATFTLYFGATYDDPVDDMYSFTPALPGGHDGPRFARPAYKDPRFVNPENFRAAAGANRRRPMSEVHAAWDAAVQACRHQELDLAVRLDIPNAR